MTSTAEWEEKLANPDPKIKWALDVMDREGEEFEGFLGKIWTPIAAASLPLFMNFARNSSSRLPLRTNIVPVLATTPLFALFGHYTRQWVDNQKMQEEAMMKHYIITHPDLFPEPKKVKYIDHIQAWRPVRW